MRKKFQKSYSNHTVILIALCQEGVVLRCYVIFFCYKLLHSLLFLVKSICDRDLVHERISDHASSKKIFRVKLCSLVNAGAISNETEGRINNFWITLTKIWKHCSRYRRYLLERHRVWLNKETDVQGISTVLESRENSSTDLINRLFFASNLLISSFRKTYTGIHIICIFLSLSRILIQMLYCGAC